MRPTKIPLVKISKRLFFWAVGLVGLLVSGCQTVYYDTLEAFGLEKREILVDRIEGAQESQELAQEEFQGALDTFLQTVDVNAGVREVERAYRSFESAYEASEARAAAVSSRIDAVEDVADALFDEWKTELDQYRSPDLYRQSLDIFTETQGRYNRTLAAMKRAESKMQPVLDAFKDQVLFLKHNLNALALASLEDEARRIESDVEDLLADMQRSIEEARAFVDTLREARPPPPRVS